MSEQVNISFGYGEQQNLPEKENGQLLFTTDTKKIYLDMNDERYALGGGTTNPETPTSEVFGDPISNYAGSAGFEWIGVKNENIPSNIEMLNPNDQNKNNRACYILSNTAETKAALSILKNKVKELPWENYISLYATNPSAKVGKNFTICTGYEETLAKGENTFDLSSDITYTVKVSTINNKDDYINIFIDYDSWNGMSQDSGVRKNNDEITNLAIQNANIYIESKFIPFVSSIALIPKSTQGYLESSHRSDSARYILAIDIENCKIWTNGAIYKGWGWDDVTDANGIYLMGINAYLRADDFPNIGTMEVEEYSFVTGTNNSATGSGSFVTGAYNIGNGSYTMVGGRNNKVNYGGTAFGRGNNVNGQLSSALGQYNELNGHNSAAIGNGLITTNTQEVAIGNYNLSTKNQTLFSIGNGQEENRHNVFEITNNGKAIMDSSSVNELDSDNATINQLTVSEKLNAPDILNIKTVNKKPEVPELNTLYTITEDDTEWLYVEKYGEIWDGTIATEFDGGSGLEEDPFLISTAEQLAAAVNMSGYNVDNLFQIDEKNIIMSDGNNGIKRALKNVPKGIYTFFALENVSAPYQNTDIYVNDKREYYFGNTSCQSFVYVNKEDTTSITITYGNGFTVASTKEELTNEISKIKVFYTPLNPHYKLTKNILLNDVSSKNWYNNTNNKEWFIGEFNGVVPDGYFQKALDGRNTKTQIAFSGNIDGNGYKICGLYYSNDTTSNCSALIPNTQSNDGVNIENLFIDNSYVISQKYAGILTGVISNGAKVNFNKCGILKDVIIKSINGDGAGGLVGYVNGYDTECVIKNCYNIMPYENYIISSSQKGGAMVGIGWGQKSGEAGIHLTIKNSYGIRYLYNDQGVSQRESKKEYLNNYYAVSNYNTNSGHKITASSGTQVQSNKMIGLNALNNMPNLNENSVFVATEEYPKLHLQLLTPWKQVGGISEEIAENILTKLLNDKIIVSPNQPVGKADGTIWIQLV